MKSTSLTMGSLFSGIGGLDLGLEWAGFGPVLWQVEREPFPRAVLARHWPHADRSITDVCDVAASSLPRPFAIVGGYPCQDNSGANPYGKGLEGARSGLWFVMRDIVSAFAPPLVIVENVASGAKRWLCRVRSDLHSIGYRTRAVALSAADVGAPHLRRRIFVVALADAFCDTLRLESGGGRGESRQGEAEFGNAGALGDPNGTGLERWASKRCDDGPGESSTERASRERVKMAHAMRGRLEGDTQQDGRPEPESERGTRGDDPDGRGRPKGRAAQSGVGRVPHGLSGGLDGQRWPAAPGEQQHAWEPPRTVEGRQEHRAARLKGCGNAVVPQCGYVVGRIALDWIDSLALPA